MTWQTTIGLCLFTAVASPLANEQSVTCPNEQPANAEAAWTLLKNGNDEFVKGDRQGGALDKCRREVTKGEKDQKPFAIVLSCADARVPVEMVFDQRIGDVFVVRVAGNVATDEAIGSIEYAIQHLETPKILVVMGHQRCGAVAAALAPAPSHDLIPSILNRIYPAVVGLKPDQLDRAIESNVALTVKLLPRYSPIIAKFAGPRAGQNVRGAYYSLDSGKVTALPSTQ